MLCGKTENNSVNKIYKRTFQLIYEMQDTAFEDLLEIDKSKCVHDNNIYTLLIEIYKLIHHSSLQIMRNLLDGKVNQYSFRNNYILKLPATTTCRYGTQALCFKESFLRNKIPSKYKNINTLEEFKFKTEKWNSIICI